MANCVIVNKVQWFTRKTFIELNVGHKEVVSIVYLCID